MRFLLDTHVLLWAAADSPRLSQRAGQILDDPDAELAYSAASVWEVAIKSALGRDDFDVDPRQLALGLSAAGFTELAIEAADAAAVRDLPPVHRDPFDRILVAQARRRGLTLATSDTVVAAYGAGVELVC